ncbi:hypothetical protein W97_08607 [Coniosporium apollinis CBS 100218]|uniref:Membrane insertase YidC/Oxa/ALB C-terminal domain-containing protein n=1 Tax=Coniosporium apollinis (strain CBS 100218) TaxID=1168221 RepID=R7Z596_CONA1|nr:uncharacterized protein W97_08607 [Coniosporium apollinis CBS 100218]EON69347.1 hypothetical protein W97_08607 [Coniosporium apollinis CBS 100218]
MITEQIGYLKSLGLDFGWGTTAMMEWILEHVHVYTSLPWWGSIALTAFLIRAAMFRPYMTVSDAAARRGAMKEITDPLTAEMKRRSNAGDGQGALQVQRELSQVYKAAGIRPWAMMVGPLLQMFVGFGMFRLLRNMASLPVPGLESGGLLWIKDLTISDPYFVLPVACGGMFFLLGKLGGESGSVSSLTPAQYKMMLYFLPAISIFFVSWMPAALQFYFVCTTLLGAIQSRLFQWAAFRSAFGLTPIVPIKPAETANSRVIAVNATSRSSATAQGYSYEAPTVASSIAGSGREPLEAAPQPKQEGILGRAMGTAKTSVNDLMEQGRARIAATTGQARKEVAGSKSKHFLRQAEEYERRRMMEIEEEKSVEEEERRMMMGERNGGKKTRKAKSTNEPKRTRR